MPQSQEVSFSDFITYFHKLSHENIRVCDLKFTIKKRSLIQFISANLHFHLLKDVLTSYLNAIQTLNHVDINGVSVLCFVIMNFSMA